MFCLRCGAQNLDGAKFCNQCGAPLTDGALSALDGSPAEAAAPEPATEEDPQAGPQAEPEPEDEPRPEDGAEPEGPEPAPGTDGGAEGEPAPGEEPVPAPGADPVPEGSPAPPESWGSPVTEVPPQEWPDGDGQAPFQEGGKSGRGLGTGAIVGIIVGGVAVVALIVAAVLFLGGSPTADAPSDEPAAEEDVDSDVKVDGIGEGLTGVGKGDGDTGSDVAAATDLGGTVFDLSRYEGTPSEVEDFLQSSGLELSDSWASDGGGFGDAYANVSFAGPYGGATPIEGTGEELMVTVEVSLGSTAVTWDEDGYAEDLVSSLDELASDAEVTGVTIDFDSPVGPSDFPSAARAIYTAMDLPAGSYVSASSDELLSSALAEFGISADNGDVTDYIGDVLFVDGASFAFRGRDAYCQVSLMGGEEFGNTTMVTVDINS